MIDRHQSPDTEGRRAPPRAIFAKFPPDDDDLPAGPPGGGGVGGGGFGDDGNFKRGRFSKIGVVLGIILAAGFGGAVYFGMKSEGDKMTVEQVAKEKKNIFVLPQKHQVPLWRKWAADPKVSDLQQEALIQLAWADDAEGVNLATKALAEPSHAVRG